MPAVQSETLQYKYLTISSGLRFSLYVLCMLAGLSIQFLIYFSGHTAAGLVILAAGSLLMIGSSYTKVPKDLGYEEWKPVTEDKFNRVLQNYAVVHRAKIPLYLKKKEGKLFFIILSVFTTIVLGNIAIGRSSIIFLIIALDLALFLYPLFLSGHVTVHAPKELELKMSCFLAVLLMKDKLAAAGIRITPFFRFDKDSKGNQIPEDVRLMLDAEQKPADLIGVQLQVSINKGPNGAVPYMYGVVIFKGGSNSRGKMEHASWDNAGSHIITELGEESDFAFLIVRQQTENGGYHTTKEQCQAIVRQIGENLALLSKV